MEVGGDEGQLYHAAVGFALYQHKIEFALKLARRRGAK